MAIPDPLLSTEALVEKTLLPSREWYSWFGKLVVEVRTELETLRTRVADLEARVTDLETP